MIDETLENQVTWNY